MFNTRYPYEHLCARQQRRVRARLAKEMAVNGSNPGVAHLMPDEASGHDQGEYTWAQGEPDEQDEVKYCNDKFITATQADMGAVDLQNSDLEGNFQAVEDGKRIHKARRTYLPGEYESSSEEEDILCNPPSLPLKDMAKTKGLTILQQPYSPVVRPSTAAKPPALRSRSPVLAGALKAAPNVSPHSCLTATSLAPLSSGSPSSASLLPEKMDQLEQEVKAIRAQITLDISGKLDTIISMLKGVKLQKPSIVEEHRELEQLHSLPIGTFEGLEEFVTDLASHPNYKEFMTSFLHERSTHMLRQELKEGMFILALNRTVNDICRMLITNDLARGLCLTSKSAYKRSLGDKFPGFIELVFDAVKNKGGANHPISLVCVKRSIGEWLRQARLRVVGDNLSTL